MPTKKVSDPFSNAYIISIKETSKTKTGYDADI